MHSGHPPIIGGRCLKRAPSQLTTGFQLNAPNKICWQYGKNCDILLKGKWSYVTRYKRYPLCFYPKMKIFQHRYISIKFCNSGVKGCLPLRCHAQPDSLCSGTFGTYQSSIVSRFKQDLEICWVQKQTCSCGRVGEMVEGRRDPRAMVTTRNRSERGLFSSWQAPPSLPRCMMVGWTGNLDNPP